MTPAEKSRIKLLAEIEELRLQLERAEEALRDIVSSGDPGADDCASIDPALLKRNEELLESESISTELRLRDAYSHIRIVNEEIRITSEELQVQSEELLVKNRELERLCEESRRSEEMLAAANNRMRTLLETLPVAVTIAEDPQCRLITTNPAGSRMFGASPEQNISASGTVREQPGNRYFSSKRELEPHEMPMQVAVSQNRIVENFEIEARLEDGRRWIGLVSAAPLHDRAGTFTGGVAVVQDITELKRSEEALRENEGRLRLAQESAHVGIWDWNVETGEVDFTPELNKLYGLPAGTVTTYSDWTRLVHPDDIERIEAERDEKIAGHESFDVEFRARHSSGEYRWLSTIGGALYNEEGKVTRVFGVNSDITERRRAEEEIRRYTGELQDLNEELSIFNSSAVGRELRMIELKNEINELCAAAGLPPRYEMDFTGDLL